MTRGETSWGKTTRGEMVWGRNDPDSSLFCICIFYGVGPILVFTLGERESVNLVTCMESCFKALNCLCMHDADFHETWYAIDFMKV